jgi:hypothetical protein
MVTVKRDKHCPNSNRATGLFDHQSVVGRLHPSPKTTGVLRQEFIDQLQRLAALPGIPAPKFGEIADSRGLMRITRGPGRSLKRLTEVALAPRQPRPLPDVQH